jgi:hypothetical protein
VNSLRTPGRWVFADLTEIYQIDADFKAMVEREVDAMIVRRPRAGRSFRLTPFCMHGGIGCGRGLDALLPRPRAWPGPLRRRLCKKRESPPDRARAGRAGAGKTRV